MGQPGVEHVLLARDVLGHDESECSVELHEILVQALRLSLYTCLIERGKERQQGHLLLYLRQVHGKVCCARAAWPG